MNQEYKEELKEYFDQALATGKADASNLAGHILDKLDDGIGVSIERHVNGKLRAIITRLDAWDIVLKRLEILLEDKAFIVKLFDLAKQAFAGAVALGGAYLLYDKIHK